MPLPPLPGHRLTVLDDRPADPTTAFVTIRHVRMRARFGDGAESADFGYDVASRSRLDAVVVVPYFRREGTTFVLLRSALRPPVALRPPALCPYPESEALGELWEVPAGLVEADECTPEGVIGCAARELHEETGYEVPTDRLTRLGPATFPSPGVIGERHYFFAVEIDPGSNGVPPEDGSALERGAVLAQVPLDEALEACRVGAIEDAKTELALRRLDEWLDRADNGASSRS
jgi:ADP-ribose pyrophosphatase